MSILHNFPVPSFRLDVAFLVLAFILPAKFIYVVAGVAVAGYTHIRATQANPLTEQQSLGLVIAVFSLAGILQRLLWPTRHQHVARGAAAPVLPSPKVTLPAERLRREKDLRVQFAQAHPQVSQETAATSQFGDMASADSGTESVTAAAAELTASGAGSAGAGHAAATSAAPTAEAATPAGPVKATVDEADLPLSFKIGPDTAGEHCWSPLSATQFNVRGKNYIDDRVKVPSEDSVMELVHVDLFNAPEAVGCLAASPDHFVQKAIAKGDTRFFVVVVFQAPGEIRSHLALYYAVEVAEAEKRCSKEWNLLWRRFVKGDDDFKNARWKVIPSIAEGNWMVRRSVGSKPALLGTKLTHYWTQDTQYIECDCDVGSSKMATMLVGLLQQYAKYLVIDLGFVLQGESEEELSEHVLGTVRLSRIDLASSPSAF